MDRERPGIPLVREPWPFAKPCAKSFSGGMALAIPPSQVVISNGAKHALHNALCAILEEGDEVLIVPPCWVSYPEMVKMAGGVPVYVETDADDRYALHLSAVEQALSPRTRAILLNSPCNPTGEVIPWETLAGIADIARERDLWIISDEIYEEFCLRWRASSFHCHP